MRIFHNLFMIITQVEIFGIDSNEIRLDYVCCQAQFFIVFHCLCFAIKKIKIFQLTQLRIILVESISTFKRNKIKLQDRPFLSI